MAKFAITCTAIQTRYSVHVKGQEDMPNGGIPGRAEQLSDCFKFLPALAIFNENLPRFLRGRGCAWLVNLVP